MGGGLWLYIILSNRALQKDLRGGSALFRKRPPSESSEARRGGMMDGEESEDDGVVRFPQGVYESRASGTSTEVDFSEAEMWSFFFFFVTFFCD